jgi:dihydrolipoamide dehydrogenase
MPTFDPDIAKLAARHLIDGRDIDARAGVLAQKVTPGCPVRIELVDMATREPVETLEVDAVLVATGRVPVSKDLGLASVGVETQRGFIPVDGQFRTTAAGVWAIGDCIPGPMLAHKAEEDGVACAEGIAGKWSHVDYDLVPAVVFTHPEIAAVGKTEEQLVAAGAAYKKGVFPFRANGRARTIDETAGKVKVLADAATDRVLGIHIIGPSAGDLIGEAAAAMTFGATAEDIARVCHAHPTLPEALKEAALAVSGQAIHA